MKSELIFLQLDKVSKFKESILEEYTFINKSWILLGRDKTVLKIFTLSAFGKGAANLTSEFSMTKSFMNLTFVG